MYGNAIRVDRDMITGNYSDYHTQYMIINLTKMRSLLIVVNY